MTTVWLGIGAFSCQHAAEAETKYNMYSSVTFRSQQSTQHCCSRQRVVTDTLFMTQSLFCFSCSARWPVNCDHMFERTGNDFWPLEFILAPSSKWLFKGLILKQCDKLQKQLHTLVCVLSGHLSSLHRHWSIHINIHHGVMPQWLVVCWIYSNVLADMTMSLENWRVVWGHPVCFTAFHLYFSD